MAVLSTAVRNLTIAMAGSLTLAACGQFNWFPPQPEAGPPQFAELMPVTMVQPMAPPPAMTPAPAAPAPVATGPAFGGHLASYSKEADAVRGWNEIIRRQGSIGTLKRYLIPVSTQRGQVVRLIAGDFASAEEAGRFCTWAKQQALYCAVMQIDPDGKMAGPPAAPAATPRAVRQPRQPNAVTAPPTTGMPAPMAPPMTAPMAPAMPPPAPAPAPGSG